MPVSKSKSIFGGSLKITLQNKKPAMYLKRFSGSRVLETAFEKVLRRILRRCLAVGFRGRQGSEKALLGRGSKKGLLRKHLELRCPDSGCTVRSGSNRADSQ